MRTMRAVMLGIALLIGGSSLAAAQVGLSVQLGIGDRDDRQAYREGYRQGRWDAQNNRRADADDNRWREGDDRRAYRDGYFHGYNEVRRYSGNGYVPENARRFGYDDGYQDGLRDCQTGHSFRPTHNDHYEDADRGYYRELGDKRYYKQAYREAYTNGYERGYNSSGWYR